MQQERPQTFDDLIFASGTAERYSANFRGRSQHPSWVNANNSGGR